MSEGAGPGGSDARRPKRLTAFQSVLLIAALPLGWMGLRWMVAPYDGRPVVKAVAPLSVTPLEPVQAVAAGETPEPPTPWATGGVGGQASEGRLETVAVSVRLTGQTGQVLIDGEAVPAEKLQNLALTPGHHEVSLQPDDGGDLITREVEIRVDEPTTVVLEPLSPPGVPAPETRDPKEADPSPRFHH